MINIKFHDIISNLLPKYLYIVVSKLDKLEYDYVINLREDVDAYVEDDLPYWVESLYQMSNYTSFGPTFSTLNLFVSEQVYQDYLDLDEDSVEHLDSLMENINE
tara:strand:- start:2785 stop:3096 length:312 start_codon:yes stop_codon:yes gene_type:complete